MKRLVAAITGKKRAGKNTVGDYLEKEYGYSQISFAGKLKEITNRYIGCPSHSEADREEEREFIVYVNNLNDAAKELGITFKPKEQYRFVERFTKVFAPYAVEVGDTYIKYKTTYRKVLQLFGTDVCRYFVDDIWVDEVKKKILNNPNINFVVTDLRFDNEALMIASLGGVVIEVVREGCNGDGHSSEAGISEYLIDVTIENTTKAQLYAQVDAVIEQS